jgi:cytidyltransferase-like protein
MVTVGLCAGCFDVLHYGHVAHLEAAKRQCNWLIVAITPDDCVNKGPGRPVFKAEQRQAVVRALGCVDGTVIGHGPNPAMWALKNLKPNRYFKGSEYRTSDHIGFVGERHYCEANGIEVVFTDEPTFSTTETIKRLKEANVE